MRIIEMPQTYLKIKRCPNCKTLFEYNYLTEMTTVSQVSGGGVRFSASAVQCPVCGAGIEANRYEKDDE